MRSAQISAAGTELLIEIWSYFCKTFCWNELLYKHRPWENCKLICENLRLKDWNSRKIWLILKARLNTFYSNYQLNFQDHITATEHKVYVLFVGIMSLLELDVQPLE